MILQNHGIKNFRNIRLAYLEPSDGLNIILGDNGSGKSALLESIYLLGRGRSFRTTRLNRLVRKNTEGFALRSVLSDSHRITVGVVSRSGKLLVTVNENVVGSRSELIRKVPVCLLSDSVGTLVDGRPEVRRKFLSWIMFHVEPSVSGKQTEWNRIRVSLSHLLKFGTYKERKAWYRQFDEKSRLIVDGYYRVLSSLEAHVSMVKESFGFLQELKLELNRGWPDGLDLYELLLEQDTLAKKRGYILAGPQRADVVLSANSRSLTDYFSNGQKRIMSIVMVFSATRLIADKTQVPSILLLDDIESELDQSNQNLILDLIVSSGFQSFVVTSSMHAIRDLSQTGCKVFHVEHGRVSLSDRS